MIKGFVCHKPGSKSAKIIARDHKIMSRSMGRDLDFVFDRGKGVFVWDVDNRKYMDFSAAIAVMDLGWNNPSVTRAVREQLGKGMHSAFTDFYSETPLDFAEYLVSLLPRHLNQVFFANSGTESIEAAMKCARWHTKKPLFMAFNACFHGRTFGSLSMTNSKPVQRQGFEPLLPVKHVDFAHCYRCPFGQDYGKCGLECVDAIARQVRRYSGRLSSFFYEPIQGEGGYIVPPKEFLPAVQEICGKNNVLFCADEVQAGGYRTGHFLASTTFKVKPDIVSMSKAVGGGLPLGACFSSREIMDWPPGSHANTFGGNLLACACGMETLKQLKKLKAAENAVKQGDYLLKRLKGMMERYSLLGDARGKGLMVGAEIVKGNGSKEPAPLERDKIICACWDKGLILLPAGASVIRFSPPLILSRKQAEKAMNIFESALRLVSA